MFRFERQWMSDRIGSGPESPGDSAKRVTVDAVRSHFRHQFCGCLPVRGAYVARALVPRHEGEENLDSAAMKIGDHLLDPCDAPRQGTNHVVLVAVVNANIRIHRPDEHGVNATVTLLQIVQVSINGVMSRAGVVEEAVFDHHLRLDETGLRPLEFRSFIFLPGITCPDPCLHPPMGDVLQPSFVIFRRAYFRLARRGLDRIEAIWSGNLISVRRVMSCLGWRPDCKEYKSQKARSDNVFMTIFSNHGTLDRCRSGQNFWRRNLLRVEIAVRLKRFKDKV